MGLDEIRIEEPVRFSFHCLNFLCLVPEYVPILVFHYREFVDVFKCGPAMCNVYATAKLDAGLLSSVSSCEDFIHSLRKECV